MLPSFSTTLHSEHQNHLQELQKKLAPVETLVEMMTRVQNMSIGSPANRIDFFDRCSFISCIAWAAAITVTSLVTLALALNKYAHCEKKEDSETCRDDNNFSVILSGIFAGVSLLTLAGCCFLYRRDTHVQTLPADTTVISFAEEIVPLATFRNTLTECQINDAAFNNQDLTEYSKVSEVLAAAQELKTRLDQQIKVLIGPAPLAPQRLFSSAASAFQIVVKDVGKQPQLAADSAKTPLLALETAGPR